MMLLCAYGRASRLYAFPEPVPRLVPRWLYRSGQRMRWTNHFSASCTRKYTRVPTPVSCCSALPYRTYTPLPPPTPPRSPPGACVVAYAACDKKIQNQDFSFDPSHPSQLHPSLLRRRRAGRGPNLKCDVCKNYSPGDQCLPARASLAHSDPLVSSSIAFCRALHRVRRSWGRYIAGVPRSVVDGPDFCGTRP